MKRKFIAPFVTLVKSMNSREVGGLLCHSVAEIKRVAECTN